MKLRFVWVGKTRNRPIASLVGEYLERAGHFARISVDEIRDLGKSGREVERVIGTESEEILERIAGDAVVVALDEQGEEITSRELARFLDEHQQRGTRQVTFVAGGYAGLSDGVRRRADKVLSLSRMTLTHEMARLFLAEQIYRALTIIHHVPYQK